MAKTDMALLSDLRGLIEQARQHVAQTANSTLTLLYWNVGRRIQREVLQDGRAEYGEQIVSTLSTQLMRDYGQGFGLRSLRRMVQFADAFPDENIVATLSRQLSWSHFIEILPLKQPLEREFYAEMSHRTLERAHPARTHRRSDVFTHSDLEKTGSRGAG